MKLRTCYLGIGALLVVGFLYFFNQISPKNLLHLQHYSDYHIYEILKRKPELVEAMLDINPIQEFGVDPNTFAQVILSDHFEVEDLIRYKTLKQQYPTLSLTEVIFLNTTLKQRIIPTFETLGYQATEINELIQSEDFLTAIKKEDNHYINALVNYATLTRESLQTVMMYAQYDQKGGMSQEEEVVRAVSYFNDYLKGSLEKQGYTKEQLQRLEQHYTVDDLKLIENSQLAPDMFFELASQPHFKLDQLIAYTRLLNESDVATAESVVQTMRHPYVLMPTEAVTLPVIYPQRVTVFVNETYQLPAHYEPDGLMSVSSKLVSSDIKDEIRLQYVAKDALKTFMDVAATNGYLLKVIAGFSLADELAPDHQTGLSVDLKLEIDVLDRPFEEWVSKALAAEGYILRECEHEIAGVYHIRYVGTMAAQEMFDQSLSFEQYVLHHGLLD